MSLKDMKYFMYNQEIVGFTTAFLIYFISYYSLFGLWENAYRLSWLW